MASPDPVEKALLASLPDGLTSCGASHRRRRIARRVMVQAPLQASNLVILVTALSLALALESWITIGVGWAAYLVATLWTATRPRLWREMMHEEYAALTRLPDADSIADPELVAHVAALARARTETMDLLMLRPEQASRTEALLDELESCAASLVKQADSLWLHLRRTNRKLIEDQRDRLLLD